MPSSADNIFPRSDSFAPRHLGPRDRDLAAMLSVLGSRSLDEFMEKAIPGNLRMRVPLATPAARGEFEVLKDLAELAGKNQVLRSMIGMGYSDCLLPTVIQRNVLENPGWYTQYTPYQAEISQGRMEALFNFQTLVCDLTGLEAANASLLDEATAAAEAMTMCHRVVNHETEGRDRFLVAKTCHPQTIAVVQTRAEPLGIHVDLVDPHSLVLGKDVCGLLLQYPDTNGQVEDITALCTRVHDAGAMVVVATDLLALTLLQPPGKLGADIAVGSAQRFGVPMGYGGPHAGFMTTHEKFTRQMPGRIIGLSKDSTGKPALRLALATREQHIRREKATSNICTAQVLLSVIASMYAVWHGPEGLTQIATRVRRQTGALAHGLREAGCAVMTQVHFDTLRVKPPIGRKADDVIASARKRGINLRDHGDGSIGISLDETTEIHELVAVQEAFGGKGWDPAKSVGQVPELPAALKRTVPFLTHPVFQKYRAEHELLRYIKRLEAKDLSLTTSMIPLGSCTMKLNSTTEMLPVTWPGFARLHPFAPLDQALGYKELIDKLSKWLSEITGFAATSLQPNAGSQGEYCGLLAIRAYHRSRGQGHRNICLIPSSAHGTNPASAALCGMTVVVVKCDEKGNVDVADLRARAGEHKDRLAALMITYPSTHGVFEATVKEICKVVHDHGGQVYLDGANMNAQVGLMRPGDLGADVCHLNLHKTFCIPHGGGGPGVGPICVAAHLAPFLPGHPVVKTGGASATGPVSSAPFGSALILVIPYAYIAMMGPDGLTKATQVAILNANYVAKRLTNQYPVLYTGQNGCVAHECILDLRPLKAKTGIEAVDVAKRLMDYGFHAPTLSFPVAGTLMIEPTESESKEELDRFCDAMSSIRAEIAEIENGTADKQNNVLKHAPHTAAVALSEAWDRPYSRERACYPAAWLREHKYWPSVSRVNDLYGDKHLVCTCPPIESYSQA